MDYAYIRAWGELLGSFPYYIEGEIEKARRDRAPQTAIYRRQDGSWATFEEIRSEGTRGDVTAIIEQMQREGHHGKVSTN